ncbi:MAG: alcohol dehydrogenase catalytic domain-containing protein [Desulfobacteraceae bacterium]|nr:alcohol dehydrogenase catalytic domain-containing protein [Desulfobacteraceae bacterium]
METQVPGQKQGEALVKVYMAGICGTDIEIFNGYAEFSGTPGHEFAGIVEAAPGYPELLGKRIVADINCGCGECRWCRHGDARHCESRRVIGIRGINGAFAEYLSVPVKNLHFIPDSVDNLRAVFAEPLAAALEIAQQIHIKNTDRVAVLGDGKMGLLAAIALKHYTGNLLLAGRYPEKLAIAEDQRIDTVRIGRKEPDKDIARRLGQFDMVVEATGSPAGINTALALVRPKGRIIVKSTSRSPSQIDFSGVVVDEIHIVGSRCGDIDLALRFLEHRWVDVAALVEKIYPFSGFTEAFERARQKGSLKVLLDINDSGTPQSNSF